MKKVFLLLLLIALFMSCKKDNPLTHLKMEIPGTWELERVVCGFCPNPLTNYPAGNENVIVFAADGSFERRTRDTLLFRGNYALQRSNECDQSVGDMALITNERPGLTPLFIQIVADKLTLSTPYCYQDGSTSDYRRIR